MKEKNVIMYILQSESSEDNSPEVARKPCVQEVR